MSRYIRQPGQSNFNEVDIRQIPEWDNIIACTNWDEIYSSGPRICLDTQKYTSYKFVYNSYCVPFTGASTYIVTNNSSANYRTHHESKCYYTTRCQVQFDVAGCGVVQYSSGAVCTNYGCFLNYNSFELTLTPGNPASIGYWANNFSPQSCCPGSLLSVGTSNQSWGSIEWVEFKVTNTTFQPKSGNASWYVYGKQR